MNAITVKSYGQPSIGCYLDQSYRNSTDHDAATVRLAESMGFPIDREGENLLQRAELDCLSEDRDDSQCLSEFADEAIDWLNSQETRTGLYWSNDGYAGAFGLWVGEIEDIKDSVEFTSTVSQDYPPDDFRGEWLHVSDHGNCTLYVREDKAGIFATIDGDQFIDREIWSVV